MKVIKKAIILLVIFLLGSLNPRVTFAESSATLSPEAQTAFQKGMVAAQQGAWDVAFKYFTEVRGKAPFYAPVFFNLALVHENNGKELAAIAWFRAYLTAGADPAEKAKVEAELLKLEVGVEAKAGDILKQATQLADMLPQDQYMKKEAYRQIFISYVGTGDIPGAEKFGREHGVITAASTFDMDLGLKVLAEKLIGIGDISKAEAVAGKIQGESYASQVWTKLATDYAKKKDFSKVEAIRPKIKSMEYPTDLTDLVKACLDGGHKDLAQDFSEMGSAEGLGAVAEFFADAGDKETARKLLSRSVALVKDEDPNGIVVAARTSIKAGDLDTLRILKGKMEKYLSAHPTPSIFTAKLAGYYSWLKDFKKADEIFATIPPDDPKDIFKSDRSTAANEILKAAVSQGDFKRFQRYLPENKVSPFLPSELGEMFATLAWQKILDGKAKDAEKIIEACPDGGSLEGWKVNDPNFHRDAMYRALAYKAAQAGRLPEAYEFAGKLTPEGWKMAGLSGSIFDAMIKKEDLEGAKEALKKNGGISQASVSVLMDLAELTNKKGSDKEAKEFLEQAYEKVIAQNDVYSLDRLIDISVRLHEAQHLEELRHLKKVNAWTTLAAKLESDTTFDPTKTYEEAKALPPGEVPGALARLAENYWNRLHAIDHLKRDQEA